MEATDTLRQEHRVIEVVLTGLERIASAADSGARFDREGAEKALEILRNFADRCHHAKEEQRLFALMEAKGMPRQGGPIGVMLQEHEEGRSHVRAMLDALPAASAGDAEAASAFVQHAQTYVALLRQHIEKEDGVLYPMAERMLCEDDDRRLADAFEAIEREEMGEGVHEKYHQWAHELADHGH